MKTQSLLRVQVFGVAALSLLGLSVFTSSASAQTTNFSLPLSIGSASKLDLGTFAAGTTLKLTLTGNGALQPGNNFHVLPDGSLFAPTSGSNSFANAGATNYPTAAGGDGVNRFAGGANFDTVSTVFGFAGKMTTDTTDPAAIRFGAVVGTFSPSPSRSDWFHVGYGNTFVVPTGGADLFLAVTNSFISDNQGLYSGTLVANAPVPEASTTVSFGLLALGIGGLVVAGRRRKA
jgi:hypothetical protein